MVQIIWDETEGGNADHIAARGLTFEDVESVVDCPLANLVSHSSHRPMFMGYTVAGDLAYVVFEWVDDDTIYPVTAFLKEATQ
jgi:uncharacterized DUF497 family protein